MSRLNIPEQYSSLDSLVSIYGTVQAVQQRRLARDQAENAEKCECRFSIQNEAGRFSVRAIWSPQRCDLLPSSRVQVIGTLRGFFFRQCRQHHHLIEALVVLILAPDARGRESVRAILHSEGVDGEGNPPEKPKEEA